jgi:hypothetical protein
MFDLHQAEGEALSIQHADLRLVLTAKSSADYKVGGEDENMSVHIERVFWNIRMLIDAGSTP